MKIVLELCTVVVAVFFALGAMARVIQLDFMLLMGFLTPR